MAEVDGQPVAEFQPPGAGRNPLLDWPELSDIVGIVLDILFGDG